MSYFLEVITFQAGYNSAVVLFGTTFLGIASGLIGAYSLLRKRALMGDALAHSALPGLCLAFIFASFIGTDAKQLWLLLTGAAFTGVLGVLTVQFLSKYSRLSEDTSIGVVLSTFFGFGVVLMSVIQSLGTGEEGGLNHFIYGQTAAMRLSDAYLTLIVALIVLFLSIVLIKEFRLVSFDPDFALSDGWPISLIDLLMMSLVVVVTVVGLQTVGLLLIIALLVIPSAAARFWTNNLNSMLLFSALIGGLSGYFGSAVSTVVPNMPAGAVIVITAGIIFFISFVFAPARGLLGFAIKNLKLKLRITEDHFLRELFEIMEIEGLKAVDRENIKKSSFLFSFMKFKNLIEVSNKSKKNKSEKISFTTQGLRLAEQKVRNHRLWEEYLVSYADMPISHVDYSADLVEHILPDNIVKKLEKSLKAKGLKEQSALESLHPLETG